MEENYEYRDDQKKRITINPIVVIVSLSVLVVVVLLIITLINLLRTNPFGNEIVIDNIDQFYNYMPQTEKDMIFSSLYDTAKSSFDGLEEDFPTSGALIREGTASGDNSKKMNSGDFVVDIDSLKQSYKVQFEWNYENSGGNINVLCVPKKLVIYENSSECKDYIEGTIRVENEYQISYTFSAKSANKIILLIQDALKEERITKIVVDETSLKKIKGDSDYAYSFDIETDGGNYNVKAKIDESFGKKYVAVLVSGDDFMYGGIFADEEHDANTASSWLKNISGNDKLKITIKKDNS